METFGDLDTRKLVERELQDAHREAELFINAVPSILIGLDSQGRIKRWNEAAAQTFDLKNTAVLGKRLANCGIKWLNPEIEPAISNLMRSERRVSLDGFRFEKAGESRLLGMTVNWIKSPQSRGCALLIVSSDITEKKKAENELRFKTAFLEAQIQATIDGILVVDERANIVWKNQKRRRSRPSRYSARSGIASSDSDL